MNIKIYIILFLQLIIIDNAYAYIDPVSGGILIQILVAVIAGITTFWLLIKKKILSIFKKEKKNKKDKNDEKKTNT